MCIRDRRSTLWNPELSALSPISQADQAIDMALRTDSGAPDSRYRVVITAADREAALQAAEKTGAQLDALVSQGVIGGYDSPARFLPSQAVQAARRASLPNANELQHNLQAAQQDSPLSYKKLNPFLADIAAAHDLPTIDRSALNGTSLALAVDSLLLQHGNSWSVLLPLRPGEQAIDAAQPVSYTHLDVYKRQRSANNRPQRPERHQSGAGG